MSMPTSAIAATADGFTWSPGMLPAERTSTSPPPRWARKPAAIWERPALCTQTNRTLGLVAMGWIPFEENDCCLGVVKDLAEQGRDAGLDVVADRPDHLDGLAGGVGDFPVFVPFAGEDRTGVTAAHRDDHIGGADDVVGQGFGEGFGELDPPFGQRLDGQGADLLVGLRAGGTDVDLLGGQVLGQGCGHLGAAGVVDTDEQDLRDAGG